MRIRNPDSNMLHTSGTVRQCVSRWVFPGFRIPAALLWSWPCHTSRESPHTACKRNNNRLSLQIARQSDINYDQGKNVINLGSKKCHKSVHIKVFLLYLLNDTRIWLMDLDGPKTCASGTLLKTLEWKKWEPRNKKQRSDPATSKTHNPNRIPLNRFYLDHHKKEKTYLLYSWRRAAIVRIYARPPGCADFAIAARTLTTRVTGFILPSFAAAPIISCSRSLQYQDYI